MEQPWYTWVLPLVHVDVRNRCPRCEATVRQWARAMGIDPDLVVWEARVFQRSESPGASAIGPHAPMGMKLAQK